MTDPIQTLYNVPLYKRYVYKLVLVTLDIICIELFSCDTTSKGTILRYYDLDKNNNVITFTNVKNVVAIEIICSNDPKDFGNDC